jgi:hypothetical protein
MVKSYSAIGIVLLMASCILKGDPDESLTRSRTPNTLNALRLDGYYFSKVMGEDDSLVSPYFLYRNGVIISAGSTPEMRLGVLESLLIDESFIKKLKRVKDSYGVYLINNDRIEFEMWYPGPGPPKLVFLRQGVILNDSTFRITKIIHPRTDTAETTDEIYRFKKFHPKPDSTNDFIK